jgi:hypothetical protein
MRERLGGVRRICNKGGPAPPITIKKKKKRLEPDWLDLIRKRAHYATVEKRVTRWTLFVSLNKKMTKKGVLICSEIVTRPDNTLEILLFPRGPAGKIHQ